MVLAKSGFGENSAESFVIDAGVIYKGIKYDETTKEFTGDLLGATDGGVEINIEKKYRKIAVDGTSVMDVKGLNVVDTVQATVKASLKELTSANLALSMNGKVSTSKDYGEGNIVIDDRYIVQDGDYIDNMAVVGMLSGTGDPIIFIFDNVLITSALSIKMEDGKEASIEITGQANGTYQQLQDRVSPYRIIYPGKEATTPQG